MKRTILGAAALCLIGLAAVAQTAPPTRIRGTIAAANAHSITVATREGPKLDVALNDPLTVMAVKKVRLSTIGKNAYVGIATKTGPGGKPEALEVLVFPEAMRGAGEGHYAWDLQPGSMMTNGTVSAAVRARSGRDLTVAYKGQDITIHVPLSAPVVTFVPAARADVKSGARVFMLAAKDAEGHLSAGRITVSKNGVVPPM